jgi:hypothetical protein
MANDVLDSYKNKHGYYDRPKLRANSLKFDAKLRTRIHKETGLSLTMNAENLNHIFIVYDKTATFVVPIKGKNRDYNRHIGYYYINNDKGLQGWELVSGSAAAPASAVSNRENPVGQPTEVPEVREVSPQPVPVTEKTEYDTKTNFEYDFLYPSLNNPDFAQEIAAKKEFTDTRYDGQIRDIEQYADILCNTKFELAPHQLFVKNFLSNETPYNSLLLYHGLGTGKTCSAIGIAEESRAFMKQIGLTKGIFIIATPNVQQNFKIQLFDPRKLRTENGVWNINACVGNSLLKEINPTNMQGLTKEKVVALIQAIINQYYVFMGYVEFANYIQNRIRVSGNQLSDTEREKKERVLIEHFFNNRLIVIDEVHNIRLTDDNKNKRTTALLMRVAKYAQNMKLVVLSATPMYNSYTEIVWLVNLLNTNDKRETIEVADVFDSEGEFREGGAGVEGGRELLMRKLVGYVSYVRGENPYNFPYRIYPADFDKTRAIQSYDAPSKQLNGAKIPAEERTRKLPLYVNTLSTKSYQYAVYDNIIHAKKMGNIENMDAFGYTMLQGPIESLNIVYPHPDFVLDKGSGSGSGSSSPLATNDGLLPSMIGKAGLERITTSTVLKSPFMRTNFQYKPEILKTYGRVFHPENIRNYSAKIASICQTVLSSDGIVLIYSQYIDGGVVPIALALEELGFGKYTSPTEGGVGAAPRNLFKTAPTEPLDALQRIPRSKLKGEHIFYPAKYVMITGDASYSPNNAEDIKAITSASNKDGREIKVVLISKAGSEGLDFKWIRQVHVLEPWYNMNRIEQIIGRGVRNMSHCGMPFIDRNVEIYLHCTRFDKDATDATDAADIEPVDLYIYRLAEKKAVKIGRITRLLKQTAVDCLLNIEQTNFTEEKLFAELKNQNIRLRLSSQTELLPFRIGDKRESYTDVCDYMDTCEFQCLPNAREKPKSQINYMTYSESFMANTKDQIVERIRQLFRERAFYSEKALIQQISVIKKYPLEQIYNTLTYLIENPNEYLTDRYGRRGYLIEKSGTGTGAAQVYYAFQPIEITDTEATVFERTMPVDYKRKSLYLELNPNTPLVTETIERQISEKGSIVGHKGVFDKANAGLTKKPLYDNADDSDTTTTLTTADEIYRDMVRCIQTPNEAKPSKESKMDWYYNLKFSEPADAGASGKKSAAANKREKKSLNHLLTSVHGLTQTQIEYYAIRHYLDTLTVKQKTALLVEFLQPAVSDNDDDDSLIHQINRYFHERLLVVPSMTAIVFSNENSYVILKRSATNVREWTPISPEDRFKLVAPLKRLIVPNTQANRFIGFMHPFKGNDIVFKIKDTTQKNNKNNKGVKCDIMSKPRIIEKINHILGEELYQTRGVQLDSIDKIQLCILLEILMRHATKTDPPNVRFYDAESAILNGVVDM